MIHTSIWTLPHPEYDCECHDGGANGDKQMQSVRLPTLDTLKDDFHWIQHR